MSAKLLESTLRKSFRSFPVQPAARRDIEILDVRLMGLGTFYISLGTFYISIPLTSITKAYILFELSSVILRFLLFAEWNLYLF